MVRQYASLKSNAAATIAIAYSFEQRLSQPTWRAVSGPGSSDILSEMAHHRQKTVNEEKSR